MQTIDRIKRWAKALKALLVTTWLVARHPDTPRLAKWVALATVAYALSPIDLIPDFIPVLGFLDDVLLVPVGIWLTLRLTPPAVMQACQQQAAALANQRLPASRWGLGAVIAVWAALCAAAAYFFWFKNHV